MLNETSSADSICNHPAIRDLSLTAVLAKRGCTHARVSPTSYRHHIYRHGEVIFTGDAHQVWAWLEAIGSLHDLAGVRAPTCTVCGGHGHVCRICESTPCASDCVGGATTACGCAS